MPTEDQIFEYLDELRESGVTNMFGAPQYLIDEFDLDKIDAREYVQKWMNTFEERHPA